MENMQAFLLIPYGTKETQCIAVCRLTVSSGCHLQMAGQE